MTVQYLFWLMNDWTIFIIHTLRLNWWRFNDFHRCGWINLNRWITGWSDIDEADWITSALDKSMMIILSSFIASWAFELDLRVPQELAAFSLSTSSFQCIWKISKIPKIVKKSREPGPREVFFYKEKIIQEKWLKSKGSIKLEEILTRKKTKFIQYQIRSWKESSSAPTGRMETSPLLSCIDFSVIGFDSIYQKLHSKIERSLFFQKSKQFSTNMQQPSRIFIVGRLQMKETDFCMILKRVCWCIRLIWLIRGSISRPSQSFQYPNHLSSWENSDKIRFLSSPFRTDSVRLTADSISRSQQKTFSKKWSENLNRTTAILRMRRRMLSELSHLSLKMLNFLKMHQLVIDLIYRQFYFEYCWLSGAWRWPPASPHRLHPFAASHDRLFFISLLVFFLNFFMWFTLYSRSMNILFDFFLLLLLLLLLVTRISNSWRCCGRWSRLRTSGKKKRASSLLLLLHKKRNCFYKTGKCILEESRNCSRIA